MQPAAKVEARDDFLRVLFPPPEARTADFHYFWLRHNCDCCRHPATRERTICSSDVPIDIRPESVGASGDGIAVVWRESGGTYRSEYPLAWLRQHAYAVDRPDVAPPASDVARIEIARGDVPAGDALRDLCLERVRDFGAVVVRGLGVDTEEIIGRFERGGYRVIETHFGRIEDLRTDNTTNENTDQLGYTDAAVDLHTDQPFLEVPPRYQMLHCMREADRGGDNAIADGLQAALYLRSLDRGAFDLITGVPVRFLRQQKNFTKELVSPIVELRDGAPFRVRSSYFTLAPHRMPFERMEAWYRAYNRFVGIVEAPRHQYRFLLRRGDFLLYDNYRMLHARTKFEGPRWVRGVYFDRPERRET